MVESIKSFSSQESEEDKEAVLEKEKERVVEMFNSGGLELVVDNLSSFVESGFANSVFSVVASVLAADLARIHKEEGMGRFRPIRTRRRARRSDEDLIHDGLSRCLDYLRRLDERLTASLLEKLIARGYSSVVMRYLDLFDGLDAAMAEKFIDGPYIFAMIKHIDSFNVDHNEVVGMLIDKKKIGPDTAGSMGEVFHNFSHLSESVAYRILDDVEYGFWLVFHNLRSFVGLTPDIAERLSEEIFNRKDDLSSVLCDLAIVHEDIPHSTEVLQPFDKKLTDLLTDDTYLLHLVPLIGDSEVNNLFPHTMEQIRKRLSSSAENDEDLADYLFENLYRYYQEPWVGDILKKAMQQYSVAEKFLDATFHVSEKPLWGNEVWVDDVANEAKKVLSDHGQSAKFEGFADHDPYEDHGWRFNEEQVKSASALAKMLKGEAVTEEVLERFGVSEDAVKPILKSVGKKIDDAYSEFLDVVRNSPHIEDEEAEILLNPESGSVNTSPLLDTVRSLAARYIVQEVGGFDVPFDLDSVLKEGFKRYMQVYEIDVPLYDKLYDEFDVLRESGRNPLEVYLGRDGIYAYIGRRAQDVARRRKMGYKKRKELKAKGEILEIHPKYLVYPRYFRDNLDYETKREFLEHEGISPEADPMFYDTGYTGTIPEQIMRIMDFDEEEVERRIRLLSARTSGRRVRGVSSNARSEIVEHIEHNAKLEDSAEGLVVDERSGRIRHIAKPVAPTEQFYFMMIKQAISRHYWVKEQLHHEPSESINIDSEHYTLRVRESYKDVLPKEFLINPQDFLLEQGTFLKGSKGEGDYPDEDIRSFALQNGKEVVAKRIELRKAKEMRKEFSVLIAAQKAGLPTAAPVGFVAAKEKDGHSYLLMEKIAGWSGRNLEAKLRKTGNYSEEQIEKIMSQVAYKNRKIAELFRKELGIDKRWRVKDTIIDFDEKTGEVGDVIPIDWERVQNYDSDNPKEID